MSTTLERQVARAAATTTLRAPRRRRIALEAHGEAIVWLTGGALAICVVMILGLLSFVAYQGLSTFWPHDLVRVDTVDGRAYLGEIERSESYAPESGAFSILPEALATEAERQVSAGGGQVRRRLLRTENFELTNEHFRWISDFEVAREERPEWALCIERFTNGRFYGTPSAYLVDGQVVAEEPGEVWRRFEAEHPRALERIDAIEDLVRYDIGAINAETEELRLGLRRVELDQGRDTEAYRDAERRAESERARLSERYARAEARLAELQAENRRSEVLLVTADGQEKRLALSDVVRAYPANRLDFTGRLGVYASRWGEFVSAEPRESNQEGGVFPAIFGTVLMTMIMVVLVVPFGVLAALYLREYAKPGPLVSLVRIAVNNLAGVPSVVFGVFGLGFFCYIVGVRIDELLFAESLPNPTYGKGGLMWASLTLALLTLPVVIVATEEALAAVPGSMREGSYATGATKWQTIQRIVLPRAMPGIMTGMILAIARGAGEVAPLMLVGAAKIAPKLLVDNVFPYVHPERSFLHLGFHILDLGFQSQNSEAAKPMVYTTTLLLIGVVVLLNVVAIDVRRRLRSRFATTHV